MTDQRAVTLVATHIAPARGYGGVAESSGRLVQAWAAQGRDITVCASDASQDRPLRPDALGLPAWVPVRLYHAWGWRRWGFGWGAPLAVAQTCRRADAVYISGVATWPTSLAGLLCRLTRRPFVVATRGGLMVDRVALIRRHKPHKWWFYRLITLPTLRAAAAVHVTSAVEADGVRRLCPTVPLAVIANGLDLAAWPALPARPQDGTRVLCYVGRLSPEKGILPFLRWWLAERRPQDRFVAVGGGTGDYAEAVTALAREAGGAITLQGDRDPAGVRAVLAASDALVMPSGLASGENFGNAAAEALACGRPILVSRGLPWDAAVAAGCGLSFGQDERDGRATLRRFAALPAAELAAMGAAARSYAEAHLALDKTAERLWSVLASAGRNPTGSWYDRVT